MIQGMVTDQTTENAAESREISIGWRLWQMVFRAFSRSAIVASLIVIPFCMAGN